MGKDFVGLGKGVLEWVDGMSIEESALGVEMCWVLFRMRSPGGIWDDLVHLGLPHPRGTWVDGGRLRSRT